MNSKRFYTTPQMDIIKLACSKSCLAVLSETTQALGNSYSEDATDYNDGNEVLW